MSDIYAATLFTRCNLESDTSSEAATLKAGADFDTCTGGLRINRTACSADHTATMLNAHTRIAAVREACNACAYPSGSLSSRPDPPKARFTVAQEAAYDAAGAVFVASTFLRCNKAALDSSVAASADSGGDVLVAYAGVSSARMACIAAGNALAPTPLIPHPCEYLRVSIMFAPFLVSWDDERFCRLRLISHAFWKLTCFPPLGASHPSHSL